MSDLRTKGHRTVLAAVLLLGCVSANATWIASAQETITDGCSDCGSRSGELLGLGPNANLTGYTFVAKHKISDALLASPPVLFTNGRVQLHLQNERGIKAVGYESPKFSRYLAYDHLSTIENGRLAFNSWQTLFDSLTQRYVRDYSTRFVATIGEVMVRQATSVPEPSAILLMLLGLGATLVYRRKATTI
jgi:PEP-CTERM motif